MKRYIVSLVAVMFLVSSIAFAPAAGAAGRDYGTHLAGRNEVPSRDTRAQGQAIFNLNEDGTELSYKLTVSNIRNVVASHIHVGPRDQNGPVVAFLFGNAAPGGGRFDGVLAEGKITEDDLVGPLAGEPLSSLIAEMDAGNTYVNVHTNDGNAPSNEGPGDFPGGEIRGQIETRGRA